MKLIKEQLPPLFQNKEFNILVTGDELVRLWKLSYKNEGGNEFPSRDDQRICGMLTRMFPEVNFHKLVAGRILE